jgi:hypothetical protein
MKKLLIIAVYIVCLVISPKKSAAQTYAIPISFHIIDHGTDFSSVTESYLGDLLCKVNKTFSAQLAASFPGFPYMSIAPNSHIVFYVNSVQHITGIGSGGTSVPINPVYYADGINVYLYNFTPLSSDASIVAGEYIAPGTSVFAPGGAPGRQDIILIGPSTIAYGGDLPRAVLCHEIGHFLNLKHLDGSPYASTCMCLMGSGDCAADTPPAAMTFGGLPTDASGSMPQNVMQGAGSPAFFFTHDQIDIMRRTLTSTLGVWGVPCRPLLANGPGMSTTLAAHPNDIPPVLAATQAGWFYSVKAGYGSCMPFGIRFKVLYFMPDCANGAFTFMTGMNPAVITSYGSIHCPYSVRITAIFPDGVAYTYPDMPLQGYNIYLCRCDQSGPSKKSSELTEGTKNPSGQMGTEDAAEEIQLTGDENEDMTVINAHINYSETSVASVAEDLSHIDIYPNPASDKIFFKNTPLEGYSYNVTNNLGQVVQRGKVSRNSIGVGQLTPGVYYLQVISNEGLRSKTLKFLKS